MPELATAPADASISGAEKLLTLGFENVTIQQVADANESKSADIASAATTALSTATASFLHVTGTTTITALGTVQAGTRRIVVFDGALTLTHNATSLILPTGANITTAAGDVAVFVSEGGGNWRCVSYQRANGTAVAGGSTAGKHCVPILSGSMSPKQVAGCATVATFSGASGQPDVAYLAFDASTEEHAQFIVAMPKSWNEGTVTFQPRWMHPATVTNFGVCWKVRAVAVSNDDTLVASFGTAQSSVDTGGTTSDAYLGPESSAITIAGTPAAMDLVLVDVYRDPLDAGDTLAVDAWLIGIDLFITTDADTDA